MAILGMMHSGMSTWMTVSAWLGLALVVLAVAATVWLVATLVSRGRNDVRRELDLRYARGDISADEYRERRQHLRM